jgi:hypothetical protein
LGPWKPCSVFPKLQDDLLLCLLLMGGKSYSAFYATDGNQVPYSHFLMHVKDNPEHLSHILDHSNALQQCNDGMFLESLLCSTVCRASHSNGIEGILFQPFLLNLVYHLQVETLDLTQITLAGLEHLNGFSFDVPFLSPPTKAWPDELNIPGMKLGLLERSTNLKKIDLWASCGLSGEAKDSGSEINLETIVQILKRIPEQAKVEHGNFKTLTSIFRRNRLQLSSNVRIYYKRLFTRSMLQSPILCWNPSKVFRVPVQLRKQLLYSLLCWNPSKVFRVPVQLLS